MAIMICRKPKFKWGLPNSRWFVWLQHFERHAAHYIYIYTRARTYLSEGE